MWLINIIKGDVYKRQPLKKKEEEVPQEAVNQNAAWHYNQYYNWHKLMDKLNSL